MQIKTKLMKRARTKFVNDAFVRSMIEVNPKSELLRAYKNTLYCNFRLTVGMDNTLTGTYCKNRWCMVCGRIRTGVLINGYISQLQGLKDPQFVTLTLPTVNSKELPQRIKDIEIEWRKITDASLKGKRIDFKGIRKAECTVRPNGMYHYHLHLLVSGVDNAQWLVKQWLKRFPDANADAQDIRPADERSYKEIFKYFTKLISSKSDERVFDEFDRLDVIFTALRGKRTYQPFGGVKLVSEDIDAKLYATELPKKFEGCQVGLIFRWVIQDWETQTGQTLTDYKPSEQTKELVKKCSKNKRRSYKIPQK